MNIEWRIDAVECYPEKDGERNVVFTVHWRVNGSDGDLSSTSYGSVPLQSPEPGTPFTPFKDLTKEQVVGWVQAALGEEKVADIEAGVAKGIENQRKPPVITPPLPWVA